MEINNIAQQVQIEMNQKRLVSLMKNCKIEPDALDNPMDPKGSFYSSLDRNVIIYHDWTSDTYTMKFRETGLELNPNEISVWIKEFENPRPEHIVSNAEIKSINFNNPNNLNGKILIDSQTLWKILPALRARMANIAIQEHYDLFKSLEDGSISDEIVIEKIAYIEESYHELQKMLHSKKIKVLNTRNKEEQEKYNQEQTNKANGLSKDGSAKKNKVKVKVDANGNQKFNIKNDPMYNKYKDQDNGLVIQYFGKIAKKSLNDKDAWTRYAEFKQHMSE